MNTHSVIKASCLATILNTSCFNLAYADPDVAINEGRKIDLEISQALGNYKSKDQVKLANAANMLRGPYGQYLKKGSEAIQKNIEEKQLKYPDIPKNATEEERLKILLDAHEAQSGHKKSKK